jgi:hypothetical protein
LIFLHYKIWNFINYMQRNKRKKKKRYKNGLVEWVEESYHCRDNEVSYKEMVFVKK